MNCVPQIISQIPGILSRRLGASSGMRGMDSRCTILFTVPSWVHFSTPFIQSSCSHVLSLDDNEDHDVFIYTVFLRTAPS